MSKSLIWSSSAVVAVVSLAVIAGWKWVVPILAG